MTEKPVIIHTDGACSGNPGPGGWGAILAYGDTVKELSGGEANTTNNRMELMGAIMALEGLTRPSPVELHTEFAISARRDHQVDPWLEAQWLEDRRQEAGEEHRTLAKARRGAASPRGELPLGEGPCRP